MAVGIPIPAKAVGKDGSRPSSSRGVGGLECCVLMNRNLYVMKITW